MQAPSRVIRRKIRFLQSELQMLQHYHLQITELFEDYKSEYSQDVEFFISKAKEAFGDKDIPEESNEASGYKFEVTKDDEQFREQNKEWFADDKSESNKKSDAPEWARKLFKKIALMTHPDRVNDDDLRVTLQKSFLRASKALEDGKLDDLIGVAVELNLDSGLADESLIPLLNTKIKSCRDEIQVIERTDEWQWGESLGVPDLRAKLLYTLLSDRGFPLSKEQASQFMTSRESS
jgi:hypothetical protein